MLRLRLQMKKKNCSQDYVVQSSNSNFLRLSFLLNFYYFTGKDRYLHSQNLLEPAPSSSSKDNRLRPAPATLPIMNRNSWKFCFSFCQEERDSVLSSAELKQKSWKEQWHNNHTVPIILLKFFSFNIMKDNYWHF